MKGGWGKKNGLIYTKYIHIKIRKKITACIFISESGYVVIAGIYNSLSSTIHFTLFLPFTVPD